MLDFNGTDHVVQIVPLWIAPNLLTLTGFLMLVVNFAIMTYYDPHFYASSRDHLECSPIPNWVWLVGAICNFLSHTLGKAQTGIYVCSEILNVLAYFHLHLVYLLILQSAHVRATLVLVIVERALILFSFFLTALKHCRL